MRERQWRSIAYKVPVEVCTCGATCAAGPLWGCRFCAGRCCPHCTYAPEGLAVCFRCAEDMFEVHVPWLYVGVVERAVPRRSARAIDAAHDARYVPPIPSAHG